MTYYALIENKLFVTPDLYSLAINRYAELPIEIRVFETTPIRKEIESECWVYEASIDVPTYGYGWKYVIMTTRQEHWKGELGFIKGQIVTSWIKRIGEFYNKGGSIAHMLKVMRQIKRKL